MTKTQMAEQAKILFLKRNKLSKRSTTSATVRTNRPKVINKVVQLETPLPRKPAPGIKKGCSGCSRQIRKNG